MSLWCRHRTKVCQPLCPLYPLPSTPRPDRAAYITLPAAPHNHLSFTLHTPITPHAGQSISPNKQIHLVTWDMLICTTGCARCRNVSDLCFLKTHPISACQTLKHTRISKTSLLRLIPYHKCFPFDCLQKMSSVNSYDHELKQ